MLDMPQTRPDYSALKVPAPVRGLVHSVDVRDGYDRVAFTTENEARYVLYVPHYSPEHKSGLRKGYRLILRRAHVGDRFGVASVRAFLETGISADTPLSKRQTVRVGLAPFFCDEASVTSTVIRGKVDEMVQWEKGWHSLVVEAARLQHISVPEGDLVRSPVNPAFYSKQDKDPPRPRVSFHDRVVAFPEQQVGFFYLRTGGFRGFSTIKPSPVPTPI